MLTQKVYTIHLSDKLKDRVGTACMVIQEDNPIKAIKKGFEEKGYKVRPVRLHSYSHDKDPADVMTSLTISNRLGMQYDTELFYRLRVMIKM